MNILLVGSGAREHIIAKKLAFSAKKPVISCYASSMHPGLMELAKNYCAGDIGDGKAIANQANRWQVDYAIIGPEAPLQAGVADDLQAAGISVVGPCKALARIETSKFFARELMHKNNIQGVPRYQFFNSMEGVAAFLNALGENYVVKIDGLAGGKGVKVSGEHLFSHDETILFCQDLVKCNTPFLIEEKFIGQEFSLMAFCDGHDMQFMPIVQDHKRAYVGDRGPNTGGMGSYSDADHSLPFLTELDVMIARDIACKVLAALQSECGKPYRGILYGSFIATRSGVGVIEFNARFGDPEVMNVLSILRSDLVSVFEAVARGALSSTRVEFERLATVCKYAVPDGYPGSGVCDAEVDIAGLRASDQVYLGSVYDLEGRLLTGGSRAVAVVAAGNTIAEAEKCAESGVRLIQGPVFHREDIGTDWQIQRRIACMQTLRAEVV